MASNRENALAHAIQWAGMDHAYPPNADLVVEAAEKFLAFLQGPSGSPKPPTYYTTNGEN